MCGITPGQGRTQSLFGCGCAANGTQRPLAQLYCHVHCSFTWTDTVALGVKSYPRGVTTNSEGGIESYDAYDAVFAEMEETGMVLNLHGEVPSAAATNTCVLNAEAAFLPHLRKLHAKFPRLRIVLEHATTRAAVDCVKRLGDTVACTITAHHLALTVDDWAGQAWHFCKPVAKYPDDRTALQEVVREGRSGLSIFDREARVSADVLLFCLQAIPASSSGPTPRPIRSRARRGRARRSRARRACTRRRSCCRLSRTCSSRSGRWTGWRAS